MWPQNEAASHSTKRGQTVRSIGFPGARYDYRDWVNRHNERYPRPPVSIMGRADWSVHKN